MISKKKIEKICYVCGFNLYDYPYDPNIFTPNPEMICPSCGTHYGLDDEGAGKVEVPDEIVDSYRKFGDDAHKKIIKILRNDWTNGGMKWWAEGNPLDRKPGNWDPEDQLKNIPGDFR